MRALTLILCALGAYAERKVVCNYETKSHFREGQGKFDIVNLEGALQYCTHLNYGYAAIKEETLQLVPLNEQFDTIKNNYKAITDLKVKYPKLKVLLSVGGNEDLSEDNLKYLEVLESSKNRLSFVNSAHTLVKAYGFDGLDLAWQFHETKPLKHKSGLKKLWSSLKKTLTGGSVIDDKAQEHREQFVSLVRELKATFKPDNYILSLTVLPNVNSTVYYDPKNLSPNLDFIILQAFDFYNAKRNEKLADYPAPLYEMIDRRPDENIDFWVKYWLNNGASADKILLGLSTYGVTWKLDSDSKVDAVPPLDLNGPGDAGPLTKTSGLLSYPEICSQVDATTNSKLPPERQFKKVVDSTKRRGTYAYRLPNSNDEGGIWIGYDDPDSISNKASYVKAKGLGGIAIDDLTLDDFRGSCGHEKFIILRSAVNRL